MGDRGNCKQFVPNIFNPSKCQNCFKTKEAHQSSQLPNSSENFRGIQRQRGHSLVGIRDRNVAVKAPLKEGVLSKGVADQSDGKVKTWVQSWYILYSTGELEAFAYEDGKANRDKSYGVTVLQDFIRMLDGFTELGESHCVGFKSLKDTVYFKAASKVDFENWWKDFSTFVPSPMRRSNTVSIPNIHGNIGVGSTTGKSWLGKTYSSPGTLMLANKSRSSSVSSSASDADTTQIEFLRNQLQKLEDENKKIPKLNEEKRKLELEVNYWKEYVTNTNALKKAGGKVDFEQELTKAKTQIVELQDELNETQKKLKYTSGKLLLQNKELADAKSNLQEANHMISIHKATINSLKDEINMLRKGLPEGNSTNEALLNGPDRTLRDERLPVPREVASPVNSTNECSESHELEAKFVSLREKVKKIEKELFQKSKELEKANESRSKVAKYTRSLLQELETKLSGTQKKLSDAEDKVLHTAKELEMERERRIRLESERDEFSRSRTSSVNSFSLNTSDISASVASPLASPGERLENDVHSKYADYYRSRYKETEAALFEKDKKLAETQEKLKELQTKYKSATDQFKSLDELQVKLSDATHKLSDRQLKIHELTREIERLRNFESGYERKSKELTIQNERVRSLEQQNSELKQKVAQFENESEIFRIKETVMKEQITLLEDESSDESDDETSRLERHIEIKRKVDRTIELETMVRRLGEENKKLKEEPLKRTLVETGEKSPGVGKSTSFSDLSQLKNDRTPAKVSELQEKNVQLEEEKVKLESLLQESKRDKIDLEDKLLREISDLKGKQSREMEELKMANRQETVQYGKLKEECAQLVKDKEQRQSKQEQDQQDIMQLQELVEKLKKEVEDSSITVSEQEKVLYERDKMIQDRDCLLREKDKSVNEMTAKLKDSIENARSLELRMSKASDQIAVEERCRIDSENLVAALKRENQNLRKKLELPVSDSSKDDRGLDEKNVRVEAVLTAMPDLVDGSNKVNNHDIELMELKNEIQEARRREEDLRKHLEETGTELIRSQETVIQLSGELQGYFEHEKQLTTWVDQVEVKLTRMQAQLVESRETLESKADDLERERNNVIHLVEVTSAYIKELECSLSEARARIEELQSGERDTVKTQGPRIPPEGSAEKERDDSNNSKPETRSEPSKDEDVLVEKMNARICALELEISDLKDSHAKHIEQLQVDHANELERMKNEDPTSSLDEEAEELYNRVQELERQLMDQEKKHNEEVSNLNDGYRQELQAAFSGDAGNMDLLNRVQDLEVELEETRTRYKEDIKLLEEKHRQEIEEMKDDLGKVLQASMSSSYQEYEGSMGQDSPREIEERIISLETEMQELKVKHEGELQMEREAHQKEMEETIRDMLMVREAFQSGRYEALDDEGAASNRKKGGLVTQEEVDDMKKEYELRLKEKDDEHDRELDQVRQDMATVIDAMRQGGPSETILELTTHVQELEKELEEAKVNFDLERNDLQMKIEKFESANFFGLRRNEEMGTKIYHMQCEMEEMERKHKLELQAYKDAAADGYDSQSINELMRVNEELEAKLHLLEDELEDTGKKHIEEMEAYAMKLQEEKRSTINEMTDKVLRLESLIEETKEKHDADISEFELRSREEKLETAALLKVKIADLEEELKECKAEYKKELNSLAKEHTKEMNALKSKYEKELDGLKSEATRSHSDNDAATENRRLKRELKTVAENHRKELEGLNEKFNKDLGSKQKDFDEQVAEIRSEYEEKLKSCIKENMRRQSVTERKTDSQKIRELNRKIEELESEGEQRKREFETAITNYKTMIEKQQALIAELRSTSPILHGRSDGKNGKGETKADSTPTSGEQEASKRRIQELEEQIERYEKRIEYYRDKAHRDKEEENQRVGELQAEVHGLRSAMRELTEQNPEDYWGPKQPASESKTILRRRSDNDERRHRAKENWKRWSDLQERQEVIVSRISELDEKRNPKLLTQFKKEEAGKSGSVARRKALWESIKHDEPARRMPRPLSSIRP